MARVGVTRNGCGEFLRVVVAGVSTGCPGAAGRGGAAAGAGGNSRGGRLARGGPADTPRVRTRVRPARPLELQHQRHLLWRQRALRLLRRGRLLPVVAARPGCAIRSLRFHDTQRLVVQLVLGSKRLRRRGARAVLAAPWRGQQARREVERLDVVSVPHEDESGVGVCGEATCPTTPKCGARPSPSRVRRGGSCNCAEKSSGRFCDLGRVRGRRGFPIPCLRLPGLDWVHFSVCARPLVTVPSLLLTLPG